MSARSVCTEASEETNGNAVDRKLNQFPIIIASLRTAGGSYRNNSQLNSSQVNSCAGYHNPEKSPRGVPALI